MRTCHPLLAYANHATLRAGTRLGPWRVQSRMLLWCRGGRGMIGLAGESRPLEPGAFLLLPWDHEISYEAGPREAWLLSGIHVIPREPERPEPLFAVSHARPGIPPAHPDRADDPEAGPPGIVSGDLSRARELALLADYAVAWYQRGPDAAGAVVLARLLIAEWNRVSARRSDDRPEALRRALSWLKPRLRGRIRLEEVAAAADVSQPTLFRLFREVLGASPLQWITARRLERAAGLLAGSDLPLERVGEEAGLGDRYYFSRLFRRRYGMPPGAWRRRSRTI